MAQGHRRRRQRAVSLFWMDSVMGQIDHVVILDIKDFGDYAGYFVGRPSGASEGASEGDALGLIEVIPAALGMLGFLNSSFNRSSPLRWFGPGSSYTPLPQSEVPSHASAYITNTLQRRVNPLLALHPLQDLQVRIIPQNS